MTEFVRTSALQIYDGGEFGAIAEFDISLSDPSYGFSGESAGVTEFYNLSNLPVDFNGKILSLRHDDLKALCTLVGGDIATGVAQLRSWGVMIDGPEIPEDPTRAL